MIHRVYIACSLSLFAWCMFVPTEAHGDDVPSAPETRRTIDALIKDAPDHRATLGLLNRAMELSISYGAPAWNTGDHDACCQFYVKTGQALCAAFDEPAKASALARAILGDLHTALDRVSKSTDVDANAWTMRYVFDKTSVEVNIQVARLAEMEELGTQCAARSSFADAANAFTQATAALHEVRGMPLEEIPKECRYAPFLLSDSLFGQRKFPESAAAVEDGLIYLPDFGAYKIDLRKHFGNPALYQLLLDDLRSSAEQNPKDASFQLLYGYHLLFTGQSDEAKAHLQKAHELDPALMAPEKLISPPKLTEPEPATEPSPNDHAQGV